MFTNPILQQTDGTADVGATAAAALKRYIIFGCRLRGCHLKMSTPMPLEYIKGKKYKTH